MRIVLLAALALAGCSTVADKPASNPEEAMCDLAPLKRFVGQVSTPALNAEAQKLAGAKSLRMKPPGAMVTMDYRPDRLNISLDEQNRVTEFDCG